MTAWLPAPLTEERGSWSRSQVSRVVKAAWRPRLSSSRLHSIHGYDLPERVCAGLFILILLGFLPSRTCCPARLSPLGFLVPRTPRVSTGGDVASPPNRGTAAVDGDSFGCHTGGGGWATTIQRVESRMLLHMSQWAGQPPTPEDIRPKASRPWLRSLSPAQGAGLSSGPG